jgi:hypothetical protein
VTDVPFYDPDRMTFEDLDLNNLNAIVAYLDHPNTIALHDDLARAFPHEPIETQRAALKSALESFEKDRRRAVEALAQVELAETRLRLEQIRRAAEGYIAQIRERLSAPPFA